MIAPELRALLAWMETPHVGDRTLARLLEERRASGATLDELWRLPARDLGAMLDLHPRAVEALEDRAIALWELGGERLEAIRGLELEALVPGDVDYPATLLESRRSWPVIFAYGNLGLLEEPRVALLCSADCTEEHLDQTDRLADELARRDVVLITGTNREPFQRTATAAKRHGAPVVMCLDRGFLQEFPAGLGQEPISAARVWDERFDPEVQLLLSPFPLDARWVARSGRRRDALMCDLAQALVAVHAREGGGMARECQRAVRRGVPVLTLSAAPGADPRIAVVEWGDGPAGVAERVLALLPELPANLGAEARQAAWQREIHSFLVTAGRSLVSAVGLPLGWLVRPASGSLAQLLERSAPVGSKTATADTATLVAADATAGSRESARRMLEWTARLQPGGVLSALVPASWVNDARAAPIRSELLAGGSVLAVVSLPKAPGGEAESVVLLFRRSGLAGGEDDARAKLFAPESALMTRHELRRYLAQVAERLG